MLVLWVNSAKTAELIKMPFGEQNGPKEACVRWGTYRRHLANTIELCLVAMQAVVTITVATCCSLLLECWYILYNVHIRRA